ncbi:MAG: zinc-binding protein [Colwellia sp.]|nr:zinc-binding protein [Colwellia sp.]
MTDNKKPIVYSCSGCSNLARMAHDIALNIDSDGLAEMSCISGVIGKVQPIADIAHSGRPIIAIDGCNMGCTKSCLDACALKIDQYFDISSFGFEKRDKWDDSLTENSIAMTNIYDQLTTAAYGFKTT